MVEANVKPTSSYVNHSVIVIMLACGDKEFHSYNTKQLNPYLLWSDNLLTSSTKLSHKDQNCVGLWLQYITFGTIHYLDFVPCSVFYLKEWMMDKVKIMKDSNCQKTKQTWANGNIQYYVERGCQYPVSFIWIILNLVNPLQQRSPNRHSGGN